MLWGLVVLCRGFSCLRSVMELVIAPISRFRLFCARRYLRRAMGRCTAELVSMNLYSRVPFIDWNLSRLTPQVLSLKFYCVKILGCLWKCCNIINLCSCVWYNSVLFDYRAYKSDVFAGIPIQSRIHRTFHRVLCLQRLTTWQRSTVPMQVRASCC